MTILNLTVPEQLREFVEFQAVRKGFASPDAYMLTLIENERRAEVQARVDALLIEGLNSGPATSMTAEDWNEMRRNSSNDMESTMRDEGSYEVRPAARRDVAQTANFIALDSRTAGRRFFDAAERAFEQFARMPTLGEPFESGKALT